MSESMPVVRQLDHVMIEAEDPTALFRLFSEGFGLPVESLEAAMAFLTEAGLPAQESLDGVAIDPALVQGLHFQLVDGETPAFWESDGAP